MSQAEEFLEPASSLLIGRITGKVASNTIQPEIQISQKFVRDILRT
jgi:hypothetical protein